MSEVTYKNLFEPLATTLSDLSEVEKKELKKLNSLGINSLYELFYYFPRNYDFKTNLKTISEMSHNEYVVFKGNVLTVNSTGTFSGKKIVKARVMDDTGVIEMTWFSRPYVQNSLKPGNEYYFVGVVKGGYGFQMVNPEYKVAKTDSFSEITPIYSSTLNLKQGVLVRIIKKYIKEYKKYFIENIPKDILSSKKLMSREEALFNIHFPTSEKKLEEARRRFAFEEIFLLEIGILSSRYLVDRGNHKKYQLEDKKTFVKNYLSSLHFTLTTAQKKVITEIYKELNSGKIVNRLVQGDVGSGKTIVSMLLLLYMAENSYQGAIMAPTEILATQHYLGSVHAFHKLGIKVALLTGSLTKKKRAETLAGIKSGEIQIVVGTHALIENEVEFHSLGLIVIDEQHRFGVAQRKALRDKGVLANLIVMSATPIPRSLALSIYGDLDVSIIDELPPGRKAIKTKHISNNEELVKMYHFIDKKLKEGRQVYFIAPLIEESEKLSAKSVDELEEEVKLHLPDYRVGILHGRMSTKEKDSVMVDFKNHNLDIIISTTVIEVGVDVPNSSIIVISDSDRFGLSSLHQLRGRVGRGSHQSYCFLISKSESEISLERMKVMESTTDGFRIAEEDLRLRKSGEIFGTKQSGLTDLKFIDIISDIKIIKEARDISLDYLDKNKGIIENEYLKYDIEQKFKKEDS